MIYDINEDLKNPVTAIEYLVRLSESRQKDVEEGEIVWLAEALITLFKMDPHVHSMQQVEINGQMVKVKPAIARAILDMQEKIKFLEGQVSVVSKYLDHTNKGD